MSTRAHAELITSVQPPTHSLTRSQWVGRSVGRYDATKSVANAAAAAALHCAAYID